MEFNIGDSVKIKSQHSVPWGTDYIFTVVGITDTGYTIYSSELSVKCGGHSAQFQSFREGNRRQDKHGHWNVSIDEIVLFQSNSDEFQIGETVLYGETDEFIIVGKDLDDSFIIYSDEWNKLFKGHDGTNSFYKGNGQRHGHWYTSNIQKLKSTIQHEVSRENSDGCPRGIESRVYSSSVVIASASRPVGSETTAHRFKGELRSGIIKYHQVQLD